MKKLTLDLEHLEVETFDPIPLRSRDAGTVRGHETANPYFGYCTAIGQITCAGCSDFQCTADGAYTCFGIECGAESQDEHCYKEPQTDVTCGDTCSTCPDQCGVVIVPGCSRPRP